MSIKDFKTIEDFQIFHSKREEKTAFKSLSFTEIKMDSNSERVKTGIAAVMGNVDSWNDRIHVGAFSKTLKENVSRVRHLWNHKSDIPPIAEIKEIEEIGFEEMPEEVMSKFDGEDITGGLRVTREYLKNDLADWVLDCINREVINEMSFAYEVIKATFSEEKIDDSDNSRTRFIRELHELKLFDTSDVNWGMNSATVASAVKGYFKSDISIGQQFVQIQELFEELKAGKSLSESEQTLLEQLKKQFGDLEIDSSEKEEKEKIEEAEAVLLSKEESTSLLKNLKIKVKQF